MCVTLGVGRGFGERNSAMGVRVAAGVAVGEVPVAGVGVTVWCGGAGVAWRHKSWWTAKMRSSDFLAIVPLFYPLNMLVHHPDHSLEAE